MSVDIIIPVYGRYDLLEDCLNSIPLAFPDTPYKVYVFDNATPMDHNEKQKFFSKHAVKVTFSKQNVGFPLACNASAQKGKGKYIFLLNSDVVLDPGSGEVLVRYLAEHEDVGVVGMKLLFPSNVVGEDANIRPAGKVQHVGITFDINAKPQHAFVGWSADNPKTMGVIEPDAVTGAALMTRRSLWYKIGGLNRKYGMGSVEDCAYCLSVKKLGHRIVVPTEAQGTHYTGGSTTKETRFPLDFNMQLLYQEWIGEIQWTDGRIL